MRSSASAISARSSSIVLELSGVCGALVFMPMTIATLGGRTQVKRPARSGRTLANWR